MNHIVKRDSDAVDSNRDPEETTVPEESSHRELWCQDEKTTDSGASSGEQRRLKDMAVPNNAAGAGPKRSHGSGNGQPE
jgi:hypothetical protein